MNVWVGVNVVVGELVWVGVNVVVGELVWVGVFVMVKVSVGVGVFVIVGVSVGVNVQPLFSSVGRKAEVRNFSTTPSCTETRWVIFQN